MAIDNPFVGILSETETEGRFKSSNDWEWPEMALTVCSFELMAVTCNDVKANSSTSTTLGLIELIKLDRNCSRFNSCIINYNCVALFAIKPSPQNFDSSPLDISNFTPLVPISLDNHQ